MKTLASDSVILILYFFYHDRRIDFSRYVEMFDSAIAKIDQHLKDSNQNTQHLSDKKDLLKSISPIIKNMAENYYFNSNDQTAVSMLEYERNIKKALPEVIKLAEYIHYSSPTFAEMVRLMPEQSNDSDDNQSESDPEVRNFLVY